MSGATGTIRGELVRVTDERKARNGQTFRVAVLRVWSHRQRASFSWRLVCVGQAREAVTLLPIGAKVQAHGEIFGTEAVTADGNARWRFSMACRRIVPQEAETRTHARRRAGAGLSPRAQAEAIFAAPRQMALDL